MSAAAQQCGFFGIGGVTSEADLRQDVHDAAVAERGKWFNAAGNAVGDLDDPHFGHLLRYWLALQDTIRPPTLTHLYTMALDPTIVYGAILLDRTPCGGNTVCVNNVRAAAATVAANLLAGAPPVGGPANVSDLVAEALFNTYKTREDVASPFQWSGVFISNVIRGVAIKRGLEAESGGAHVGPNVLLKVGLGHRVYVKEAHKRRTGASPVTGTYQAFRPGELPVEVGDILVGDRDAASPSQVVDFDNIQDISDTHRMHGDIVVAVTSTDAEAIGGNIGYSDPNPIDACNQPDSINPFNVRRRRYPLTAGGNLVVDPDQRFMQENNSGNLPPVPMVCPVATSGFHQRSMGRMFVVLKPAEECRKA